MDKRFVVDRKTPLLEYLLEISDGKSRTGVKSYLTRGQVEVNGRTVSAFDCELRPRDIVTIRDRGVRLRKRLKDSPLLSAIGKGVKIIHEDQHIIVISKTEGLPTISTGRNSEMTAYSVLTEYVRQQTGDRHAGVFIVHRIDRETSGLLVFARSRQMQEALQHGWNENILERKYIAILEGIPAPTEGTVTSWLKENPKSLKMTSSPSDNGGKKAVTHYRTLQCAHGYAKVEFELETGRKNQIRIHASDLGHPIAGDYKYGAQTDPIKRLALHAATLVFRHPATGKVMKFSSPVPKSFEL